MAAHGGFPALRVNGGGNFRAHFHGAFLHIADVEYLAAGGFLHPGDTDRAAGSGDNAFIRNLSAAFGVEGGLIQDQHHFLVFGSGIHHLAVYQQPLDLGVAGHGFIARKLALAVGKLQFLLHPGGAALAQVIVPGALFLLLHEGLEALQVNGNALFLYDFPGQVDGEAVGVVKAESVLAGNSADFIGGSLVHQVGQHVHALADGGVEGFFLVFHDLLDILRFFGQLRVSGEVFMGDGVHNLIEEGLGDAQQAAVAGGPAQQAAQDIAPAGVGGGNAVGDHKGGGTDVVGDDPQGNVGAVVLVVGDAGDFGDFFHDVLDSVHLKEVVHPLHDAGQTL